MGCIFKRKWKDNEGNVHEWKPWWIKYYRNGKPYMESTRTESLPKAKRLLKRREGEIELGKKPGIVYDKVRFNELAEAIKRDYRINKKKNLGKLETYVNTLSVFLGEVRVTEINTEKIEAYVEKRLVDGLANSSINRELSALKRMFTLGARSRKVSEIPYIPMLEEKNTRKGFFELDEYQALCQVITSHLKPVVTFAYHTGWRASEIFGLTWDKVDLKEGTVRLEPGDPKNEEAREIYLNEELRKMMLTLQAKRPPGCPYVFQYEGNKIRRITRAWTTACRRAGLWAFDEEKGRMAPTKIFHDFRRTAIRNMVRSGIPERVAMALSGHKTRSVFERYNIVSKADLKDAAKKQERYTLIQNGYSLVTVDPEKAISKEGANA